MWRSWLSLCTTAASLWVEPVDNACTAVWTESFVHSLWISFAHKSTAG